MTTVFIDTMGEAPIPFDYEKASRRRLLMLAEGGDPRALAMLFEDVPVRGNKYHDPKTGKFTTGPGGSGLPAGWSEVKADKFRQETYDDHRQAGYTEVEAGAVAATLVPDGTRVYRDTLGDGVMILPGAEVDDTDVANLMTNVADLQSKRPIVGGVGVWVHKDLGFMDPRFPTERPTGATLSPGHQTHLTDEAVRGDIWSTISYLHDGQPPATRARLNTAHEYGHMQDALGEQRSLMLYIAAGRDGTTGYGASGGPSEALAEAFSDWAIHGPDNAVLPATGLYDSVLGWTANAPDSARWP